MAGSFSGWHIEDRPFDRFLDAVRQHFDEDSIENR